MKRHEATDHNLQRLAAQRNEVIASAVADGRTVPPDSSVAHGRVLELRVANARIKRLKKGGRLAGELADVQQATDTKSQDKVILPAAQPDQVESEEEIDLAAFIAEYLPDTLEAVAVDDDGPQEVVADQPRHAGEVEGRVVAAHLATPEFDALGTLLKSIRDI